MSRTGCLLLGILLSDLVPANRGLASHVHVQVARDGGALVMDILDFDSGRFPSTAFPFLLGESAIEVIPNRADYLGLGVPGATFFVLPQEEDPGLPFLGIGADRNLRDLIVPSSLQLRLESVRGPGKFALFQTDAFGQARILMNSRDGISLSEDKVSISPGGHLHLNWAFSAPGDYFVTFVAEGTRTSDGEPVVSDPTSYRFVVTPPARARVTVTRGGGEAPVRVAVGSRRGAHLQLEGSRDLKEWEAVATQVISETEWDLQESAGADARFWRVTEIFR